MRVLHFRDKRYDYEKIALYKGSALAYLDVTEEIINHTNKHVSVTGNGDDYGEQVTAYMYEGMPVILTGFEKYKQAFKNGTVRVSRRIITKHGISPYELPSEYINNPRWKQY